MTPRNNKKWTNEMDAELTRLWTIPSTSPDYIYSIIDIGVSLRRAFPNFEGSLTRNAVIGRAGRIGVSATHPRKKFSALTLAKKRASPKQRPHLAPSTASRSRNTFSPPTSPAKALPAEEPFEPSANNCNLLDAGEHQCLWPVALKGFETIVCGNKRWNNGSYKRPSMYCAHHSRLGSGGLPKPKSETGPHLPRLPRRATPRWQ